MPGCDACAQPKPHDVAPCTSYPPPLVLHTSGPPLSPWQASVTPPDGETPCAQTIVSVMPPLYAALHELWPTICTFASCSRSGVAPPEDRVPQPVIQHSVPAATSVSGRQATATHSFSTTSSVSSKRAKSLSIELELYEGCL